MATVDAVTQKAQRILTAGFTNVMLQEGGFAIQHESTRVNIIIRDFGKDPEGNPSSILHIWAPVARDVKPTPELFRWAATEGQAAPFGSTEVVVADDGKTCLVVFSHAILGDFLDPAELNSAVVLIAMAADKLDDEVHQRFGGKRYTDA